MEYFTILLDQSGSMHAMGNEPIQAVNGFVEEQKRGRDPSTYDNVFFSLYTFDNSVKNVYNKVKLSEVQPYNEFEPGGMTALYDAIHQTANDLANQEGKINIIIITDGANNAGQHTLRETRKLIADKTKEGWNFVYLGANQDSFASGSQLSVNQTQNFCSNNLNSMVRDISSQMTPLRLPVVEPQGRPHERLLLHQVEERARVEVARLLGVATPHPSSTK